MQSTARRDRPLPPRLEIVGITMSWEHASASLSADTASAGRHLRPQRHRLNTSCLLCLNQTSCHGWARTEADYPTVTLMRFSHLQPSIQMAIEAVMLLQKARSCSKYA